MTRFFKLKKILPVLVLIVILLSSCKKEDEEPASVVGTVWKTPMIDLKIYELHFLDEERVENIIQYYYIPHPMIFNDTVKGITVDFINDYTIYNRTVEVYSHSKLSYTLNGGKLIGEDLVYDKQ